MYGVREDETLRQILERISKTEERSWRRPATTGVQGRSKLAGTAGDHAATKKQKGRRDAKTDSEERYDQGPSVKLRQCRNDEKVSGNGADSTTWGSRWKETSSGSQRVATFFDASSAEDQGLRQCHSQCMHQQRCVSAKQERWWDQICEKRKHEAEDGESELEEARVSRNMLDLFEQLGQAEATAASSVRVNTSEDKQERAEQTGVGERSNRAKLLQGDNNLEQSIQDTIIFMHGLPKLKSPKLKSADVELPRASVIGV